MSFILDALKKSENERQAQADVEFATVPASTDTAAVPRWLWLLAALLVVNAIVLGSLMLRPEVPLPSGAAPSAAPAELPTATPSDSTSPTATSDFTARLDDARRERPIARAETAEPPPTVVPTAQRTQSDPVWLPSMTELILDGTLLLPPLHIDIHVFSERADERFVFINMNKYREGQRLSEGPELREITRDGVILEHRGTAFVLPRE